MDPSDLPSDQEEQAAAMAATMGFTSFGSRPSAKRRRYNPRADAMADEDGGAAASGTGANMLPVVPRSSIPLRPEDGGAAGGSDRGKDGGGQAGGGDGSGGSAPQYIDMSRSPLRTGEEDLPVVGAGFGEHRAAGLGDAGGAGRRIWWTDYYDPSSNENPWEWLEKARGLEPAGSWLPRGHGGGKAGGGRAR